MAIHPSEKRWYEDDSLWNNQLSGKDLAKVVAIMSGLQATLLYFAFEWQLYMAYIAIDRPQWVEAEIQALSMIIYPTKVVTVGLIGVTFFCFLGWFSLAYRNLYVLGVTGLHYSPGWVTGSFLLPLLNFVIPLMILQELWRASGSRAGIHAHEGQMGRLSNAATWWWLTGWAGWLAIAVVAFCLLPPDPPRALKHPHNEVFWRLISWSCACLFWSLSSIFLICVVASVNREQEMEFALHGLEIGPLQHDVEDWDGVQ